MENKKLKLFKSVSKPNPLHKVVRDGPPRLSRFMFFVFGFDGKTSFKIIIKSKQDVHFLRIFKYVFRPKTLNHFSSEKRKKN